MFNQGNYDAQIPLSNNSTEEMISWITNIMSNI